MVWRTTFCLFAILFAFHSVAAGGTPLLFDHQSNERPLFWHGDSPWNPTEDATLGPLGDLTIVLPDAPSAPEPWPPLPIGFPGIDDVLGSHPMSNEPYELAVPDGLATMPMPSAPPGIPTPGPGSAPLLLLPALLSSGRRRERV